jgi:DNA-binding response OmpR family regulator
MDRDRPVVLIVDRDVDRRGRMGGWLEEGGFVVVVCPGPTAPEFTCVGSREGRCPLAQDADLVVLDLWLESDAAMLGTPAATLLRHYGSWGKPVIVLADRHDDVMDRVDDLSPPTVDRPLDRRDLVETIRVMAQVRGTAQPGSPHRCLDPQASGPSLPAGHWVG